MITYVLPHPAAMAPMSASFLSGCVAQQSERVTEQRLPGADSATVRRASQYA